jgi:hypothetical protein
MQTLRQTLVAQGLEVSISPGRDDFGEDRLLKCGGIDYVLQMVTTPADSTFWRAAPKGADTFANADGASKWLNDVVEMKARKIGPEERVKTVLAIDARHFGVLTDDRALDEYLPRYGHPATESGFASVWIVGPTVRHCKRLGDGQP